MSSNTADLLTTILSGIPTVAAKTAVFVRRDGVRALVNIGPSTVALPFAGMYLPPAGHPVQLELRAGQLVVTGPARPLPGIGRITGVGSPKATVTAWGVEYVLPYRVGYTPALNDDVELGWTGEGGIIQGKVTATSDVPVPAVNAPPTSQRYHPEPFTAIDSGSFNGGWWTTEVYSSDTSVGAYFYGGKVRDTIPDTARILSAAIYLSPRQDFGDPSLLQLHTSATKPGGTVTFTGATVPLTQRSGWVPIPTSMVDYLKTSPGGIGFNHGGYSIFRPYTDGLSGALDIAWEA